MYSCLLVFVKLSLSVWKPEAVKFHITHIKIWSRTDIYWTIPTYFYFTETQGKSLRSQRDKSSRSSNVRSSNLIILFLSSWADHFSESTAIFFSFSACLFCHISGWSVVVSNLQVVRRSVWSSVTACPLRTCLCLGVWEWQKKFGFFSALLCQFSFSWLKQNS